MTLIGRLGFTPHSLRSILAALCALSMAACSDGYPTEDVPQIDVARMTQAQVLAALNALGKQPYLGKRWSYVLHVDCELEVSARNGGTDRSRVVLSGAAVSTRSVDGVSEVRLLPRADGETRAVTVLATQKWSDSVMARSLLTQLKVHCGNPAAPIA